MARKVSLEIKIKTLKVKGRIRGKKACRLSWRQQGRMKFIVKIVKICFHLFILLYFHLFKLEMMKKREKYQWSIIHSQNLDLLLLLWDPSNIFFLLLGVNYLKLKFRLSPTVSYGLLLSPNAPDICPWILGVYFSP